MHMRLDAACKAVYLFLVLLSNLMVLMPLTTFEVHAAEPGWTSLITPLDRRETARSQSLNLIYDVSWSQWLKAGSIQMSFIPRSGGRNPWVEATARTRSLGPVRAFWPYVGSSRTEMSARTLYPSRFEHVQTERDEKAEYKALYRDGRMIVESVIQPTDGREMEREKRVYDLDRIRDVLSSLYYLQQTDLTSNKIIRLLVQPLDKLYLVSFEVTGTEYRQVFNKSWKTKRLDIKVRKVTDDFRLAEYTKMRKATLWMSDDADHVPVEIQAELAVGFVSMRLVNLN